MYNFPSVNFPSDNFPSVNFPNVQFPKRQLPIEFAVYMISRFASTFFICPIILYKPVAEFKEFERRFIFKPGLKYGWFHLKLYQMFQDLSHRLI